MNVNAVQIILIFVVTFIVAVDQFNLSESFYQPMVTGCVVGFILGDIQTGLVVGGTYQLMAIGNIPINGEQPFNVVVGGILATVFAVTSGLEIEVAIGLTIPFTLLSQYLLSIQIRQPCSEGFICISSGDRHNNLMRSTQLLFPYSRQ